MTQQQTPDVESFDTFGILFTPERWSALEKFSHFKGEPFKLTSELVTGTRGAEGHSQKFRIIAGIADRLRETLADDLAELSQVGFTSALRSKEFSALIEVLICELYSCLDGVRRVLYSAYRNVRYVQNGSTYRLFKLAHENRYGPDFPEEIRSHLSSSFTTWFPRLERMRDQITHGSIGRCSLDQTTGIISYSHDKHLGPREGEGDQEAGGDVNLSLRAFIISDIIEEVTLLRQAVFELMEKIFRFLYERLDPVERERPCGIYKAHYYERYVAPGPDLSFASGRCISKTWFEKKPGYECPMRQGCGAYLQGD